MLRSCLSCKHNGKVRAYNHSAEMDNYCKEEIRLGIYSDNRALNKTDCEYYKSKAEGINPQQKKEIEDYLL